MSEMPKPKKATKKATKKVAKKKVAGYIKRKHQVKLSSEAATKVKSLMLNNEYKNINELFNDIINKH